MKHVVITGVSSGIGYAAAVELAGRGYHVFGSVRREGDAARLQASLGERFAPLLFDVTDGDAIARAAEQVAPAVGSDGLAGLVNNAGIAVSGPLMHVRLDDLRRQFEVNVLGVMAVTQAFLPLLGARPDPGHPPGRIVNIGSVSGRIAYPFLGPYAASKHALEAISDSLRRELLLFGVDVILIEPGSVVTPIWDKAEQEDYSHYTATAYGPLLQQFAQAAVERGRRGMPVERVARTIALALEHPHPRTRYPLINHRITGWWLPRFLPARRLDRIVARTLGFKPTA
jgi:NAD(P)-dependent dehydrogenase (short-subunit alcohol dehydrogenase family)